MAKVFVVGDLNIDVLCQVRGLPSRGKEIHADSIDFSLGGNAANFAVTLGKLGVQPEFYSCIGNGHSSGFLREELEQAGVKSILREVQGNSGVTVSMVFRDGRRGFISNKGASGMLRVQDLKPILERIEPGDILYVGGFFHLPGIAKGLPGFLGSAKRKGATLMFDFTFDETHSSGRFRDFAKYLDMVFLNEDELNRLESRVRGSSGKMSRLGVRDVIVKLGRRGSLFYTNGMITREPALKVRAIDTTGAGDVFNAAFVYGFMDGLLPEQCLKLGNWVAGWKVQRTGIEVPPRDRVHDFLKKLGS
jgi:sugar/nucleoside kinase (ribokinase family)